VTILIGDGDQTLVEERVPLTRDLHPATCDLWIPVLTQYLDLTAARGCVNADDLLVTAQFGQRKHKRHHVNVEPRLGVDTRRTNLQEIENGVYVSIETIVTLTCEREVTA